MAEKTAAGRPLQEFERWLTAESEPAWVFCLSTPDTSCRAHLDGYLVVVEQSPEPVRIFFHRYVVEEDKRNDLLVNALDAIHTSAGALLGS